MELEKCPLTSQSRLMMDTLARSLFVGGTKVMSGWQCHVHVANSHEI